MQYEDAFPQVFKTTCEVEHIMQLFFLLKYDEAQKSTIFITKYTRQKSINTSAAPSPKLD